MKKLFEIVSWWWWCNVQCPLSHLRYWLPVIWRDDNCDWTYLVIVMRHKLRAMGRLHSHDYHVGHKRTERQISTCAALCDRLIADKYFSNAGHDPITWDFLSDSKCQRIAKHGEYMNQQDAEYLGKTLGKHLREWWS